MNTVQGTRTEPDKPTVLQNLLWSTTIDAISTKFQTELTCYYPEMAIIYLALGSNVGDGKKHISSAIDLLSKHITNIVRAPLYVSKAMGFTEQADFMNTAIQGHTLLSARELLEFTQKTEQAVGRVRRFRWGPREIDIDIIFYDDQIINETNLHIPHARFGERDFVLKPLCDLAPNFVDPISKQTIKNLLYSLPKSKQSIQCQIT